MAGRLSLNMPWFNEKLVEGKSYVSSFLGDLSTHTKKPRVPVPTGIAKDIIYAGLPKGRDYEILENRGFVVGYSESRRNPLWVAYKLGSKKFSSAKRPSRFDVDDRTDVEVKHGDYTGSGFDRGHMAPNYAIATRFGIAAQKETFLMSNICPQKPKLNRQVWRYLEERIANHYSNQLEEIWVITGPIFDENITKLPSGVEVPDAFYKIVVDEKENHLEVMAFIFDQDVSGKEKLRSFLTSVDEVEKRTGLDFYSDLKDSIEDEMESSVSSTLWD